MLPKETLLVGAALLASLAPAAGRLGRRFWGFVAIGAIILLIAALLGEAPLAQVFGRWPRYEGLVSVPVYAAAVWVGARLIGPGPEQIGRRDVLQRTVAGAAIVLFIVSALESMGLRPIPSDLDRPGALLGNATDQGIVAAAFAVLMLMALLSRLGGDDRASWPTRVLYAFAALVSIVTVALSGSRAGLLALAVGGLLSLGLLGWWARTSNAARLRRVAGWGLISLAVAGAVIVMALPQARDRVFGVAGFASQTVGDRFIIWGETLALIAAHPWFGVGPSGYADAVVHGPAWYAAADPGTVLDSPHNVVLQLAVVGGIPLLLVAVGFAVWAAVRAFGPLRRRDAASLGTASATHRITSIGVIAGIGAAWLTHFPTAATAILAGLLLGGLIADEPVADRLGWRTTRTALLSVWLLFVGLATAADVLLLQGLEATAAPEADRAFAAAFALRPWDADISSIAAQSMTARADALQPEAATLAVNWGERAVAAAPGSMPARLALGVSQRLAGGGHDSVATLGALASEQPLDADVAVQHAISLAMAGESHDALAELERANRLRPGDPTISGLLTTLSGADPPHK